MINETQPGGTPPSKNSGIQRNPRGMQYTPSNPKEPKRTPIGAFLGVYFLIFLIVLGALYLRGEHLERERQAEEVITEDVTTDTQSDTGDVADVETEPVEAEEGLEAQSEVETEESVELEIEPEIAE